MARRPSGKLTIASADGAAPSRSEWLVLLAGALLPLAALAGLCLARVPLGMPGRFVYLYSPIIGWRLSALPSAILLAALAGMAVWLVAAETRRRRVLGTLVSVIVVIGLAIWAYSAPPDHVKQHVFNMHSPSQDGAFLREAASIADVGAYLRSYPERARTPPAEMRGTRVTSNPPGTTLLALTVRRIFASSESVRGFLRSAIPLEDVESTVFRDEAATGLAFCWVLTALWAVTAPVLYLVGRRHFPPVGAAAFAFCATFWPATLLFSPGKDPAQLLTVAVPLCLWVCGTDLEPADRSARRAVPGRCLAFVSGLAFVLSCMVSLVHVWIALIVVVAYGLNARHTPGALGRLVRNAVLPALLGALAGAIALYLSCGINVVAIAVAVARSQAEVTRGPSAMPWAWQTLGIPLFALFAGVALWACTFWSAGRRRGSELGDHSKKLDGTEPTARLGVYLAVGSVSVMLATTGFTNVETPRLWIPFVPVLLLGTTLQLRRFRRPDRQQVLVLAMLVFAHIATSALFWSFMDMREAETRLVESRFFD